ncbi:NAD(P)-dependent oxidoreductase [Paracraurococcus ruber]|uniref:2-hydroxy-3-oxopropionate reductase n=1 Tax=Paracraurococcus ruber TaxID=77675 RepID=A0ABS1CWA6_9PROT|nr:NAD(P)-dependent oxidoreductase [Paracraurococcus ruber]MBK1658797.1 2-hydroxy-3-oxopropionate reductase [Paracraurococcus ruber]TDG33201.1 NAD(P)-dependent oxidoreductase [Paracraurococcus ruber]
MARIGLLGVGLMGEAMARRLLARGHQVTAWNLEPERLDLVVPHGAAAAASPAAVVAASEILLCCVLHAAAVENCLFGPGGVATAGRAACAGKRLVDLSTIPPAAARDLATRLRDAVGMGFVDAPVSGGPPAARAGTLTIMAGGDAADVAAALPVLRDLGAQVTRLGETGAGQAAKMVNQAVVGAGFLVMAEALAMAEAAGLDAAAVPAALAGGFADGALLQRIWPLMQARAFDPPLGYARQLQKDLHAVQDYAAGLGLDLPVVGAATGRLDAYVGQGHAMADSVSVIRLYRPDPG